MKMNKTTAGILTGAAATALVLAGATGAQAHPGHGHVQNNTSYSVQYRYASGAGAIYTLGGGAISPNGIDANYLSPGPGKCLTYRKRDSGATGTIGRGAWISGLPNAFTDVTSVWYC